MKKINKKKSVSDIRKNTKHGKNQMDAPLTRATFQLIFEDIKVLIISTAKSMENAIRADMDEKFKITWAAIAKWKVASAIK